MRTTVPAAFSLAFAGPEGVYTIRFEPIDEWDGLIDLSISDVTMRWQVVDADREDDGAVVLGGMTDGSAPLWGDQFWFELRFGDTPPLIRYWANQVLWREDYAA